jgi:hypothetical protein
MWDFEAFISELEVNFGPHDPVGDAEKALTEISMKDNSRIVKYNVEFWKLASRVDWNESALTARYFRGLPLRLRTEVLRDGKPTTLPKLRLKAQDADDIYWMIRDESNQEARASSSKQPQNSSKKDSNKPASGSPSRPDSSANSANNSKSSSSGSSKDKSKSFLSGKLGKNGKLTNDERERRIKEGLCLYCGKTGHVAKDCSKASATARAATADAKDSKSADAKK